MAEEEYSTLGNKTLIIFILGRAAPAFAFLLVALGSSIGRGTVPHDWQFLFDIGMRVAVGLFLFFLALGALIGWLVYTHYLYALDTYGLKIRRGIFYKKEIAIPYRQIQNVDIDRTIIDQLLGMSRLVILTAGHDDPRESDDESEGIFPVLDAGLANSIRDILLKRANVEQIAVHEEPAS